MAKVKRVLNLGRIFGNVLCVSVVLTLFFLRNSILKTASFLRNEQEHATDGNSTPPEGIQSPLRAMIVDLDCLKNLASNRNCEYPIKVAVPFGRQFDDGHFMRTQYYLKDDAEKDYWLFQNIKNATESIAITRFKTKLATLRLEGNILAQLEVPADFASFARAWRNGRFLECQPVLIRPKDVERTIPLTYLDNVVKFTELVAQFNATAFIFSGTLLGWRRECSLIPHTLDVDMAIFYEDHSEFGSIYQIKHKFSALLRAILTSRIFIVHWVLGRLRNSFELSVVVDGFKIDLFYLYNEKNSTFVNGMRPEQKQRLRYTYPRLSGQICTGELHGRLVHVPCDYQKVIEADYGRDEWQKDVNSNAFVWDQSHKNKESMEFYTEDEWKNVYLLVQNKTERFDPVKVDEWMANINKTI